MGFGNLVGSDIIICGLGGNEVFKVKEATVEMTPYETYDVMLRATPTPEKRVMPGLAIYGRNWREQYGRNWREQERQFVAERVIFNPPATVVYWADKTRTVVKCGKDDEYSRETGLALCYMKKALGNKSGTFNKALRKAEKGDC